MVQLAEREGETRPLPVTPRGGAGETHPPKCGVERGLRQVEISNCVYTHNSVDQL